MKNYLVKIFLFLLPIIIIAYPLDCSISYLLSKSNEHPGEFEVWSDVYSGKANCDIAIYGSSRAWVHIDPKTITDSLNLTSYNFGIDGHKFEIQYLRNLEFQKYNKKPKIILLSVDIFSLQKTEDLYNPDQFLPYMLWNKNIIKFTKDCEGYNIADYYIPLIRYFGKSTALNMSMNSVINSSNIRYRSNGFKSMDENWNEDLEKAKSQEKNYIVKLDKKVVNLFESFIQECKTNNIELYLIYTPEYIEGQNYVVNRNEIIQIYKNISIKYQLTFLDYSNDSICLNKSLFYNALHLNQKGASIFSKKLTKDIKVRILNKVLSEAR